MIHNRPKRIISTSGGQDVIRTHPNATGSINLFSICDSNLTSHILLCSIIIKIDLHVEKKRFICLLFLRC